MGNNDASADQSVDLKKSARRRLVGAAALALFAVVVLPMVMEREPKPPSQDIQVRIPNRESLASSPETISGAGNTELRLASPAMGEQPAFPATASSPVPNDEPGKAALSSPADVSALTSAKLTDRPSVVKSAKVEHPASKSEEIRASALLAGKENSWLVRLGAYQNTGNVRTLMAKVKELGLPAYSERFDSPAGPRTRVFAGPFPTRDGADKAQARIRKIGVEGAVMAKP